MRIDIIGVLVGAGLGLVALAADPCAAQRIVGRVVDGESGTPIRGAELDIRSADSVTVARVTSDSTGFVGAGLPSEGDYFVVASRPGYLPWQSGLIRVDRGESIEVEVRLGRSAIPLEPLVVVTRARRAARLAGYRERLREGRFGSFVTRAEIERRTAASVTDLIRPLPGVDVVEVARFGNPNLLARMIAMRGSRGGEIAGAGDANWCLPGLFLDGVRVEQSAEFPVDDLITSATLEGIEVYSSAGSVPIEYQQGASVACGAVLLWTREGEPGQGRSGWWRWALGIGGFAGILFFMR